MARYETMERKYSLEGSVVWAYAFKETHTKDGMRLKQKPVKGRVTGRRFIPFKKNSQTEYAMSKAIAVDSRNYADTEAEAIEGYNELISRIIMQHEKDIKALEAEKL